MVPSLFIGHGSPMIAIEQSEYGDFLDRLGDKIEKPKAIVIFSPHWESRIQMVSDVDGYSTIYDFGGFPDELYRVKYPAKGNHEVSQKIQRLLAANGISYQVEKQRGLDHGSWNILYRIYPKADIPVIAMSVNQNLTPLQQFHIGKALSSLRMEGVLIIGSGVTVHNFGLFSVRDNPDVQSAARTFEHWIEEQLKAWDTKALFDYEDKAPYASLAVPPNGREHFVPLFHAMGAASDHPEVNMLHRSWMMNIAPNTVYQFS
ncbi:MAG: DODA-type extradiol aromatic ring-opening family dioxygenase [Sulfobacillus sp.]